MPSIYISPSLVRWESPYILNISTVLLWQVYSSRRKWFGKLEIFQCLIHWSFFIHPGRCSSISLWFKQGLTFKYPTQTYHGTFSSFKLNFTLLQKENQDRDWRDKHIVNNHLDQTQAQYVSWIPKLIHIFHMYYSRNKQISTITWRSHTT